MNTDKIYAEQLANEYAPKDTSKVVALRKLDAKAKLPANVFTYTFGIITALVAGVGMCLSMKVIGNGSTGTYLDTVAASTDQAELKTVQDFLDRIENQELYHVLITVDRLTLQIVLMKIQGYSTHEIARYLKITEKAVYRHMDRLKEKVKKIFE